MNHGLSEAIFKFYPVLHIRHLAIILVLDCELFKSITSGTLSTPSFNTYPTEIAPRFFFY